jgi:hypothetical protein
LVFRALARVWARLAPELSTLASTSPAQPETLAFLATALAR